MTRTHWLWLAIGLTAAALAATYVYEWQGRESAPAAPRGPAPTPFGWQGQLQSIAGDGIAGLRDGAAAQARFADPYGLARAGDGSLYIADGGDNNRIRRIAPDGQVVSFAGGTEGFADGSGAAAKFHTPSGLAFDRSGNLYVADTGNHAIRRISPQGVVSTVAGTGIAGYRDGPGAQAQFDGPVGVAVAADGRIFVADTYNDRIRVIGRDGSVATVAGGAHPGFADGAGALARFDTPTALAVDRHGTVWVADTRNDAIRRIDAQGTVSTLPGTGPDSDTGAPHRPISLALTHDGLLYVGEMTWGRVLQFKPSGQWQPISGREQAQRLPRPSGLALDGAGGLYVNDAASYRVHRIATASTPASALPLEIGPSLDNPLPATAGRWPLRPQDGWHEVVGTLGEVRGDGHGESRHHLHGGLDIRGDIGQQVLAIADAKVGNPAAAWGYGGLGEGLMLDALSYIHMRVGRTAQGQSLDPQRFQALTDDAGAKPRVRVRRGARFAAGDALGTINPMAHVHLAYGPFGYERNAALLGFVNYADRYPPRIERIQLLDASEQPLAERQDGRLLLSRALPGVHIVVEAWDQVDRNLPRRRLGLYALGYQWLTAAGQPLPGYESPRMNIQFDRMPAADDAVKVAYAPDSGITVHGSAITRFRYMVSNTVRDGRLIAGSYSPSELPAGDYLLRITARDYSGNVAAAGRDLAVRVQ
ncbi:NHL repeat-containing protein [Lysobacter antibioticus]|uniref:NHL repeat-containing protein n=1 Tax=Lysobacter antibioticus TaxID=84531 RepID=UPI00034C4F4B|nr:NHL repeat-containing protein [Lysobacter antibioticus]